MTGKLKDMTRDRNGEWVISFTTDTDFSETFDELYGKEIIVEIKRKIRRRSIDANNYCWTLIDQIAKVTGVHKTEVYRHAIKEIGGVSDIVCVMDKAVDRLRESWEKNGLGWQTDTLKSKTPGCTNVILYYGSSVFDGKQMHDLIQSLIQDAESLHIPTVSPKEAERLAWNWGSKQISAAKAVENKEREG